MIPTREQCIALLKKHNIKESKLVHTLLVEKVALFLANKLIEKGETINLELLEKGALLHDIGKHIQRIEGVEHAKAGYEICLKEGIDEMICNLIKKHVLETIINGKLEDWEEKVLFYADKVCKYEIIGIDNRFQPWLDKHPESSEELEKKKDKTKQLEKEIFAKLDFKPEELKEMMDKEK